MESRNTQIHIGYYLVFHIRYHKMLSDIPYYFLDTIIIQNSIKFGDFSLSHYTSNSPLDSIRYHYRPISYHQVPSTFPCWIPSKCLQDFAESSNSEIHIGYHLVFHIRYHQILFHVNYSIPSDTTRYHQIPFSYQKMPSTTEISYHNNVLRIIWNLGILRSIFDTIRYSILDTTKYYLICHFDFWIP